MLVVACDPLGLTLRAFLLNMHKRILSVEIPAIDRPKDLWIFQLGTEIYTCSCTDHAIPIDMYAISLIITFTPYTCGGILRPIVKHLNIDDIFIDQDLG